MGYTGQGMHDPIFPNLIILYVLRIFHLSTLFTIHEHHPQNKKASCPAKADLVAEFGEHDRIDNYADASTRIGNARCDCTTGGEVGGHNRKPTPTLNTEARKS